ncbi:MAG: GDSL-type esterase/lipase family protein [Phycisphaerales bacterium]|nr:GDSL-type esterase/lipase family protein [Phycisphaerales bacterium]
MHIRIMTVILVLSATCVHADPIKVACIGDSITQGNANADWTRNSWPLILGRMLETAAPGRYEVGNFGRSGATLLSDGRLPWWDQPEADAAMAFDPNIVILNLGTNDAAPGNRDHLDAFSDELQSMLDRLGALPSQPAIWLSTLTPMLSPYRHIDSSGEPRAAIEAIIAETAADRGLSVIDLTTPLAGRTDLIPDGIHPNTRGNEIMAATVFEALRGVPAPADTALQPLRVRSLPRPMVAAGKALPEAWSQEGDTMRGHGAGHRLTGGLEVGDGAFHMAARLRLLDQDNSAAAFHLGPDVFGFEGANGTLFRNGPHMGGLRLLHPAEVLFQPGSWIDFEIIRNRDQVFFMVNGDVIETAVIDGPIETLSFDPMRSTMEIDRWTIAGDVHPKVPAHFKGRTVNTPWVDFSAVRTSVSAPGQLAQATSTFDLNNLPTVLQGRGHTTHMLGDGRVLIAFQDTNESSPTFEDGVLWCGTLDDMLSRSEGTWTAKLVDGADLDEVSATHIEPAGDAMRVTFAHGGVITASTFTMRELEALVPTRDYSIPLVDLDQLDDVHVVVDREAGQYLGHPTTVLLEDGSTIVCVYPKGHGRGGVCLKRSDDGGVTWSERLPVPENWSTSREVPTIHRVIDPRDGTKRLIMWSGLYPARLAVSEDDGVSWSPLEQVGDWGGIVVMGFVERLADGRYLAMFHDDGRFFGPKSTATSPVTFTLYSTVSDDGGLTWSSPDIVWAGQDLHLCEPGCIRSPNGTRLAVLLRENSRRRNSYVIFSDDEGASWSPPRELPASLTGDRHTGVYLPDGRLFISFRDTTHVSETKGDWVGWVGTWDDIEQGLPGEYRVRLKDNHHRGDCAYPGVLLLSDGTIVTTTYGHWDKGESPYIRTVRVHPDQMDAIAGQ